uniref:Uncharacterized protein n=1 Tax=Anguilla anguilla TaxID=7936 RepID=A0A0E9S8K6_ANGAN
MVTAVVSGAPSVALAGAVNLPQCKWVLAV